MIFVIICGLYFIIYGLIDVVVSLFHQTTIEDDLAFFKILLGIILIVIASQILALKNESKGTIKSENINRHNSNSKLSYKNKSEDYSHFDVFTNKNNK